MRRKERFFAALGSKDWLSGTKEGGSKKGKRKIDGCTDADITLVEARAVAERKRRHSPIKNITAV